MKLNIECPECKTKYKLDIVEIHNRADLKRIANHDKLLEALEGMIAWTKNTAMYHLKDEELLPRGFEKWESLVGRAGEVTRGDKNHV
ncbi:hypothetical protein KAR91_05685 [Candidatus Pacearchaeota archaeon]|nr:hypothetical protein [Candidatus Pacearchaeota archaeon]